MEVLLTNNQLLYFALTAITAPLLSFIFSLIFRKMAPAFGILSILVSLAASILLFMAVWQKQTFNFSFPWIELGNISINVGILLNDLSVLMMVLVSFVALLVHIYSVEYIRKEDLKYRYFSYLSLFCFAMLCVVIADNLFVLYAFWELVGFASYLLIGFWFTKKKAVQANKKAFVMNRIGDVAFLIGLMILLAQFHTLDIQTLFGDAGLIQSSFVKNGSWVTPFSAMPSYWLTISGFCFLLGAAAKSAQFPLHSWLPDAMQGPTAVSSLIHAATMVAAGVFLLIRVSPLFDGIVLDTMASIGLFTAFMAATIALTQTDIKKVLAFSTISQLGFMVLAVGIKDNAAAIFHLSTHAFFKCLLFLAAGMVIHQLHEIKVKSGAKFDDQDMRNMGGLAKLMPITATVFIIAALALSGLPFTSGYLSKDAILISVFQWANVRGGIYWLFPVLISITSWLTAFYIFRVIFKTFFGEFKLPSLLKNPADSLKLRDPNLWMTVPAIILAICCLGFTFSINPFNVERSWLYHAFNTASHETGMLQIFVPLYINILSLLLIFVAYTVYIKRQLVFTNHRSWYYQLSYNQWYFDVLYDNWTVKAVMFKARASFWFDKHILDGFIHLMTRVTLKVSTIVDWVDRRLVDGFVNDVANVVVGIGVSLKTMQSGKLQHYYIWMLLMFLSFIIYKVII